jgi:hypothetical protein
MRCAAQNHTVSGNLDRCIAVPAVIVLDDGSLRNLPQFVEGGVRQVETAVADRQPTVGIIDDGDALAAELAGDRVRLEREHDFVVLQGQVVGNRPLFTKGKPQASPLVVASSRLRYHALRGFKNWLAARNYRPAVAASRFGQLPAG